SAYSRLSPFSDNPKQEIERAIASYLNALRVRKEAELPQGYAAIQNNLGSAYSRLAPFSDNPKQEIERAIASYLNALRVRSSDIRSTDCLKTARDLGNLGFKQGLWEIAIQGYSKAIDAVENIRSWSKNESRREEVQADSIEIYSNIIQAHINLHQYAQAFAYVERSRSKRLLDLMHVHDFYKHGEIPAAVQQLLDEYDRLQTQKDRYYHPDSRPYNLTTADSLRRAPKEDEKTIIEAINQRQTEVWQQMRQLDPVAAAGTRVGTIDITAAAQLLNHSSTTALLNIFSTPQATYIFIITLLPSTRTGQEHGVKVDLHHLPNQGINALHDWIFDEWIAKSKNEREQWATNAPNFLQELSNRLQLNTLITNHLTNITELILIPYLNFHQIPFTALPISNSPLPVGEGQGVRAKFLGDKFTIRYAPSCQVLQFCQVRPPIAEPLTYGIIEGASRDVPYASFQGSQIAQLFNIDDNSRLRGNNQATKAAYKQLIHQSNIFHAYHHANFDFREPLNASLTAADGDITLGQILTWRLPDLADIFLSCCETGLGLSKKLTDDIFTIASGFLCIGARNVFGTLWSVEQLSAAILCVLYYRDRATNPQHNKAASLQLAQRQLREMTGTQLETEFGDALEQSVQDYINQLRAYTLSLPEETAEREEANSNLTKAQNDLRKYFYRFCKQDYPFKNPTYWAAFTCQGLG
ncbi:MAG: CHAT domain-containing protein, partial [Leptolyngbyaceae cyanobacterium CAN_BIN12]|nr:CHAT domain-containing protein [Leptolyngbyaceae cyanobacterium CAN_BIN12]